MEWPALFQLMGAIGLAAAIGIRAFLPLAMLGAMARLGSHGLEVTWPFHWTLPPLAPVPHFAWLGSDTALTVLCAAAFVEILADKIPGVDKVVEAFHTVAAPLVGALVTVAVLDIPSQAVAVIAGLMVGAVVTLPYHVFRVGLRSAAAAAPSPVNAQLESLLEDLLAAGAAWVSIVMPPVMFVVAGIGLICILGSMRKWRLAAPR